jgi:transcriptional antiterminator RfaH
MSSGPNWAPNGGSLIERGQVAQTQGSIVSADEVSQHLVPRPWFALQVRARHEVGVGRFLTGKGYEPFVPLYQTRRRWSDRIKVVEAPLFPGYLFCRFDLDNRLPILTTPGVIQIVGFSRTPVAVNEAEIGAIQSLVASKYPRQPWPFLQAGDRVQIDSGPLRGLEGLLVELRGSHRLIVSVTLLQRSIAVEIDSALVKTMRAAPAKQPKSPAWQLAT